MNGVLWTADEEALLVELWRNGKSGGFIARVLGNKSRPAVLAKARRLDLQRRPRKKPVEKKVPVIVDRISLSRDFFSLSLDEQRQGVQL